MSLTGIINIKLIEAVCLKDTLTSKNLNLVVFIDQQPVYHTNTKLKNSKITFYECFSSKAVDGKVLKFTFFNDSPASTDDHVANCEIEFSEIMKNEKENDVYDLWYDLEPKGCIHFAIELPDKNDENSCNRSHSIIRKKVHQVNGHKFQATLLTQPSYCSHCHEFIYGIGLQGYKCNCCNTVVHKRCHSNVNNKCKGTKQVLTDEEMKESIPHEFLEKHFLSPTFCDHCGTMIYGLYKQGVQCKGCNMATHKRCHEYVSGSCTTKAQTMIEVN